MSVANCTRAAVSVSTSRNKALLLTICPRGVFITLPKAAMAAVSVAMRAAVSPRPAAAGLRVGVGRLAVFVRQKQNHFRHRSSRSALPITIKSEQPIAAAQKTGLMKPSAASGTPSAL